MDVLWGENQDRISNILQNVLTIMLRETAN